MTAQVPDILRFNGEGLLMTREPLKGWLSQQCQQPQPILLSPRGTSCYRGYVATWQVRGRDLYLVVIDATFDDGSPANLEKLFPSQHTPEGVHEEWLSGHLRCNRGKLLQYVHMGYESRYSDTVLFQVMHGRVLQVQYLNDAF